MAPTTPAMSPIKRDMAVATQTSAESATSPSFAAVDNTGMSIMGGSTSSLHSSTADSIVEERDITAGATVSTAPIRLSPAYGDTETESVTTDSNAVAAYTMAWGEEIRPAQSSSVLSTDMLPRLFPEPESASYEKAVLSAALLGVLTQIVPKPPNDAAKASFVIFTAGVIFYLPAQWFFFGLLITAGLLAMAKVEGVEVMAILLGVISIVWTWRLAVHLTNNCASIPYNLLRNLSLELCLKLL